jgi:TolB-like protein/Flp pilus assembly protein TadD
VFLSYASEDAQPADRICQALRTAGIEVWFDRSELRGGDAWDATIRKQIKACALFIPVISRNAHARGEGYFRLEWKLAVDRSHLIASDLPFLIPVVIDDTPDTDERIPERFREIHWTRLLGGETPAAFVERIRRLLSPETPAPVSISTNTPSGAPGKRRGSPQRFSAQRVLLAAVGVVILGALAYFGSEKLRVGKPGAPSPVAEANQAPSAFNPPPHSIAVLPFVNMSGEKDQEYFSDGLTEEVLNSLSAINELQVAARTSAFSFKGKDTDLETIAHKLNVGAILEGSVRRSGNTVRITAQLINSVTGFHLWSKTYDRDLGNVLQLQSEIATAVAEALRVTLLTDISQKIEVGGTRNPAALDAYLRASKAFQSRHAPADVLPAIAAYTEAIQLDPNYALALAGRSFAQTSYTAEAATGAAIREGFEKAASDARRAIALAPELGLAYWALGHVLDQTALDFHQANDAYARAVALAPGNAQVLNGYSQFITYMGHIDAGLASAKRLVTLDPLERSSYATLGFALYAARRYAEAVTAQKHAISFDPDFLGTYSELGFSFYALGDFDSARAWCETKRDYWESQQCLAVVYDKLGRHADAEAELAKLKALGDAAAYQYATIYAQWGDRAKALEWLDTAMRLRDPGLVTLKTDPLMDGLRKEPRFQAVVRQLKFPD